MKIKKSINSIINAKQIDQPYRHWAFNDFLDQYVLDQILDLNIPIGVNAGIRNDRHDQADRAYLTKDVLEKYPIFKEVEKILINKDFKKTLESKLDINLQGYPHLRAEFIQDVSPFYLIPHTDEIAKAFTLLIYLSKDMDSNTMGTELYENEDTSGIMSKAPFISNSGYIFIPDGQTTWHGLRKVEFKGVRKVFIVNYVAPEWRDRHQLYNP